MRVSVKERREKHEPSLELHIHIVKVSHLGNAILEVAADRLELSDGLLGISALMAVAINLKTKADVEKLQFSRSLKEEVSRLFGGVAFGSVLSKKNFVLKF